MKTSTRGFERVSFMLCQPVYCKSATDFENRPVFCPVESQVIFVPPENEIRSATIAMTLVLLAPFETDTDVVGKYRVPVSCMATPPANDALAAEVIDLSWKNKTPW